MGMSESAASSRAEALEIFKESGALLTGHFVLRSGLHSGHFFQCAQVCQYMDKVTRLAELLISRMPESSRAASTVLSPAMGGLVIGQEVARQLGRRFIFVEKVDDLLALRRGFKLRAGEPVLVVEDVITRGGRVREALAIIEEHGATPAGVAVLVDRSQGETRFPVPTTRLVEMSFPTYEPNALPQALASLPIEKPGS